jgi:hypothetical protein
LPLPALIFSLTIRFPFAVPLSVMHVINYFCSLGFLVNLLKLKSCVGAGCLNLGRRETGVGALHVTEGNTNCVISR